MFYLKHFYRVLGTMKVRGYLFVLVSAILVFVLAQHPRTQRLIEGFIKSEKPSPYFHGLISARENNPRVVRKLKTLPGVAKVVTLPQKAIAEQTQAALQALGQSLKDMPSIGPQGLAYSGIKVVLKPDIAPRLAKLIRDYLVRLVGKDKVILGAIKWQKTNRSFRFDEFLQRWGGMWISGGILLCWLLLLQTVQRELKRSSYLIEQFQRRSRVAFKSFALGGFSIFIAVGLGIWAQNAGLVLWPLLLAITPFIFGSLFFLGKCSWQE